jgi:hypothetical protein
LGIVEVEESAVEMDPGNRAGGADIPEDFDCGFREVDLYGFRVEFVWLLGAGSGFLWEICGGGGQSLVSCVGV